MTWKPTSNVVITAISIVPSFSDAETTELSGLISSLHKARGGVSMGQAFSLPDFRVFSVFLSSYFILLHSIFCSHQLLLWESTVEEKVILTLKPEFVVIVISFGRGVSSQQALVLVSAHRSFTQEISCCRSEE